jgi:hypothetical protein
VGRGQNIKDRPFAFTEHGAIQAANVLNSPRAIAMGVYVVRAFVQQPSCSPRTPLWPDPPLFRIERGIKNIVTATSAFLLRQKAKKWQRSWIPQSVEWKLIAVGTFDSRQRPICCDYY